MSVGTLRALHMTMQLTTAELLEAHRLMDSVDVPRLADAEEGEKLSISQRVALLVSAYKGAVTSLTEVIHKC